MSNTRHPQAARSAAPREVGSSVVPSAASGQPARRERRRARYRLRRSLWLLTSLKSVRGCGRSLVRGESAVSVNRSGDGSGYGGLARCSSVSSCPVCSARIRQGRADQIDAAGLEWLNRGGQLAFLTLTMPHDRPDPLEGTLSALKQGWRDVQQNKAFRAAKVGRLFGQVRAIEVTRGESGWHPHMHILLFLEATVGSDGLDALTGAVTSAWNASILRSGFRSPSAAHGVNVQLVESRDQGKQLARYLTKVQDDFGAGSWGVGAEMTRGDLKAGKRKASRVPFEILANVVETGHAGDLVLWHEYEAAMRGVRVIEPSRGLLDALGVKDLPDEQIDEWGEDCETVTTISAADWKLVCRYGADSDILDLVDAGGGAAEVERLLAGLRERDLRRCR